MALYIPPDIRKQTLEEYENFLSAKRARRMVQVLNYQQKAGERLAKLKGVEAETFHKRKERVDKALEKVIDAINSADRAITALFATHNTLINIENEETQL